MKKILVPIGSFEFSKKVLSEAREVAESMKCTVTIINVFDLTSEEHFIHNKTFLNEIKKSAQNNSEEILNSAKEVFENFKGKVDLVSKSGVVADVILDHAENGGYDLIIIGSREAALFSRGQLGSIAEKIARYAKVSVLVVK